MNKLKRYNDFINESIRDKMTARSIKSIYDEYIKPHIYDLSLTIYEKIKEWQIYEVLSEPGDKYKYGEYRPHEPWGYFVDLYKSIIPSIDNDFSLLDTYDAITEMFF